MATFAAGVSGRIAAGAGCSAIPANAVVDTTLSTLTGVGATFVHRVTSAAARAVDGCRFDGEAVVVDQLQQPRSAGCTPGAVEQVAAP